MKMGKCFAILLVMTLSPSPVFGDHPAVERDSSPMVTITAGPFIRGSAEGEGRPDEYPRRKIYVDAFQIDKFEVTNGQYMKFVLATGHKEPLNVYGEGSITLTKGIEKIPVVQVTWHDAEDYCRWVGKRLSTEAEWEKAAGGKDGRTYPWGDKPPTPSHANFDQEWDGRNTLKSVGSFPSGSLCVWGPRPSGKRKGMGE